MKFDLIIKLPEPDEIVGIAPWRDKIVIGTRSGRIFLMEHDEEMTARLRVIADRQHGWEYLP